MIDDDLIRRGDALELVDARWAGFREKADRIFEMDYEGARQDAIIIGAYADEARAISSAIAALPAVSAPDVAVRAKPGEIERAVWSAMIWAASNNPGFDELPEYTDGGNSFAEDEARAAARRIIAAIDAPDVAELVEALRKIDALDDGAECCGQGVSDGYGPPECCCQPLYGLDRAKMIARAALARIGGQ